MTFPRWRSYGYRRLESRPRRWSTIAGIRIRAPGQRSASDHIGQAATTVLPRPRSSTGWSASFRNKIRRRSPRQLHGGDEAEASVADFLAIPTSDVELEAFLHEAWSSVDDVNLTGITSRKEWLEYSRKMAELRCRHELKTAEILQREATFVRQFLSHDESTPLLLADQLSILAEVKSAIKEAQSSGKFDKLRLQLKRETALEVLDLRARHGRKLTGPTEWPIRTIVYCNENSEDSSEDLCDDLQATDNSVSSNRLSNSL